MAKTLKSVIVSLLVFGLVGSLKAEQYNYQNYIQKGDNATIYSLKDMVRDHPLSPDTQYNVNVAGVARKIFQKYRDNPERLFNDSGDFSYTLVFRGIRKGKEITSTLKIDIFEGSETGGNEWLSVSNLRQKEDTTEIEWNYDVDWDMVADQRVIFRKIGNAENYRVDVHSDCKEDRLQVEILGTVVASKNEIVKD